MERRGRGESGDYAMERQVEDVVALTDSTDGPVDLLGYSFGESTREAQWVRK